MRNKLFRNKKQGYFGGVCAGLENYTSIPALVFRILFVFLHGGLLAYIAFCLFTDDVSDSTKTL